MPRRCRTRRHCSQCYRRGSWSRRRSRSTSRSLSLGSTTSSTLHAMSVGRAGAREALVSLCELVLSPPHGHVHLAPYFRLPPRGLYTCGLCPAPKQATQEPTTDWSAVTGVASALLGQTGMELELGQGQVHPDAGSCMQCPYTAGKQADSSSLAWRLYPGIQAKVAIV